MTLAAMTAGRMLNGEAAIAASAIQALGSGAVLWAALPGRRWIGAAIGALLLAGVLAGAAVSVWAARQAPSGISHALVYAAILLAFARSLAPGRTALVTQFAQLLNPHFRPGMIPYTRAVTASWCAFAAAQLAASALLLAASDWRAWALLVGGGHAVLALLWAAAEFAVRCRRFPGEHVGFWETVRGVRRQAAPSTHSTARKPP